MRSRGAITRCGHEVRSRDAVTRCDHEVRSRGAVALQGSALRPVGCQADLADDDVELRADEQLVRGFLRAEFELAAGVAESERLRKRAEQRAQPCERDPPAACVSSPQIRSRRAQRQRARFAAVTRARRIGCAHGRKGGAPASNRRKTARRRATWASEGPWDHSASSWCATWEGERVHARQQPSQMQQGLTTVADAAGHDNRREQPSQMQQGHACRHAGGARPRRSRTKSYRGSFR